MASNPAPTSVYKIIPSAPPEPFPSEYPLSALDSKDGFVHLSYVNQVPNTADLFFAEHGSLWIVKLRLADFAAQVKVEGGFPHLYGNFGSQNVQSVHKFDRAGSQKWSEVMKASTWLE